MGAIAQRLRLRLFLEGVEVPVIAAEVQALPNAPAQCSIQIPPMPDGMEMLPRTLVHLFFFDFYEAASPFATPGGNNASPTAHEAAQNPDTPADQVPTSSAVGDDPDLQNAKYKLLFGGEVVGFQWTKNQASRSLVLQCMDWSNYWDYAYQWNNTDLFGPGVKAVFSGGSTNLFDDFLEEEGSAIIRIIQSPSVQYPKLKGLLGGIVHLLEAIGGSYYYGKQFSGQNVFFSLAELRLHITQMITAYEDDPTSSRLLNAGFDSLLGRTLGGLGQQVSFRQAINALMGIIFHETYAQPCPLFVPSSGNSPSGRTRQNVRKDPRNAFIATTADALIESINEWQTVLFELQGEGATMESESIASFRQALSLIKQTCSETASRIKDKPVLPAKSFYASAGRSIDQARAKVRSAVNKPVINAVLQCLADARGQFQRAAEFESTTSTKDAVPARLNQQIFRPDVWFSAPPRCNVLFPEHYHTLTYSRSFLTEPTRLLLKTNDEFFGEDELFDSFYVTPRALMVKKGEKLGISALFENDILEHELFTGILPVFEKMGELNIFAARSGTVNGKMPKIGLAQRSANFLYFKYRFAARQLQLQGRFNPFLACGFPALVIDKWVDEEKLQLRQQLIDQNGGTTSQDINKLLGAHFLCNLTELTHSVSQNSGTTSLNCSYARLSSESVEFLGVIRQDQTVQRRAEADATRVSVVAAIQPPRVNSLGPNMGRIIDVQDVTAAYVTKREGEPNALQLHQGPSRDGAAQPRIHVAPGLTLPARDYGIDVVRLVGNPATIVKFGAFRVTEEVPRYRKEIVDLPAEEYIRPGWYGDIWHPSMIGQAYQQFFQTGAITDEQQVEIAGQASIGVPNARAEDALQQAANATTEYDPRANVPGFLALDKQSSIEAAVAFLAETYSLVKQRGLDVDQFIQSYCWRPIATLTDLFGTSDLTLDLDGHQVLSGIEGFHSRAFSKNTDLFGLVLPELEGIVGIKRGSVAALRADVRGRRRYAIQEYISALQAARALIG